MENSTRKLRTHNIVFLVIAAAAPLTVVSAGITAAYAASGLVGVPLGYVICGILVALFAVGFCAMAREIPNTAAFFSYVSAGLGKSHGIAASWLAVVSYVAMQTALYGLLGSTANGLIESQAGIDIPWWIYSLIAAAIVGTLGLKSADFTSKILGILLLFEFIAVATFCVTALAHPADGIGTSAIEPSALKGAGLGTLLAFTIAGFMRIESSAMYSEEAENPRKTIPNATLIAILTISSFYAFSAWSIAQSAGESNIVEAAKMFDSGLFFDFLAENDLGTASILFQCLLLTSLLAAVTSFHNSIARYLMALGRERVLWGFLGKVGKDSTPIAGSVVLSGFTVVVIFVAVGAQALTGYGKDFPSTILFSWMSNAGGFGLVFLLLITSISVLRYFNKRPGIYHRGVTVLSPMLAVIGLGIVFVLIVTNFDNLIGDSELWYLVFVIPGVIIACGVVGFLRGEQLKRTHPEIYANIGSGRAPRTVRPAEPNQAGERSSIESGEGHSVGSGVPLK